MSSTAAELVVAAGPDHSGRIKGLPYRALLPPQLLVGADCKKLVVELLGHARRSQVNPYSPCSQSNSCSYQRHWGPRRWRRANYGRPVLNPP